MSNPRYTSSGSDNDNMAGYIASHRPARVSFIREVPGNIFDSPNGSALIRTDLHT